MASFIFRMDEFYGGEFLRLFPESRRALAAAQASRQSNPPPARHRSRTPRKCMSGDEVDRFLRNPSTLVGERFISAPPRGMGNGGEWRVVSYTVHEGNQGVEHEYQVVLQAFGEDRLRMVEEEVRFLLQYSTVASAE